MPLSFCEIDILHRLWGGPWSAADALVGLPTGGNGWSHWAKSGSRGTRADQGSAPQVMQYPQF
jgi:hypothetical protein